MGSGEVKARNACFGEGMPMSDLPFTIVLSDYALQKLDADLCVLLESVQGDIKQVILDFAGQEVTPESTFRLEEKLEASARESMRIVM